MPSGPSSLYFPVAKTVLFFPVSAVSIRNDHLSEMSTGRPAVAGPGGIGKCISTGTSNFTLALSAEPFPAPPDSDTSIPLIPVIVNPVAVALPPTIVVSEPMRRSSTGNFMVTVALSPDSLLWSSCMPSDEVSAETVAVQAPTVIGILPPAFGLGGGRVPEGAGAATRWTAGSTTLPARPGREAARPAAGGPCGAGVPPGA